MVDTELLLQAFGGEHVIIFTTAKVVQTDGDNVVETNASIEGFLLDADEEFLYMGKDMSEVESAVAKAQVIMIERANENEVLEALIEKPKRGDMN